MALSQNLSNYSQEYLKQIDAVLSHETLFNTLYEASHVPEKHVGKSDSYLIHRLQTEYIDDWKSLSCAGTFYCEDAAKYAIRQVLERRKYEITEWLAGDHPDYRLTFSKPQAFSLGLERPIGKLYKQNQFTEYYSNVTTIVLQYVPIPTNGVNFKLVTAYPDLDMSMMLQHLQQPTFHINPYKQAAYLRDSDLTLMEKIQAFSKEFQCLDHVHVSHHKDKVRITYMYGHDPFIFNEQSAANSDNCICYAFINEQKEYAYAIEINGEFAFVSQQEMSQYDSRVVKNTQQDLRFYDIAKREQLGDEITPEAVRMAVERLDNKEFGLDFDSYFH